MRTVQRTNSIRHSEDGDPLNAWNPTPASETDAERAIRLKGEAEAKQKSDKIDEELKLERQKIQRSKGDVRVSLDSHNQGSRQINSFYGFVE